MEYFKTNIIPRCGIKVNLTEIGDKCRNADEKLTLLLEYGSFFDYVVSTLPHFYTRGSSAEFADSIRAMLEDLVKEYKIRCVVILPGMQREQFSLKRMREKRTIRGRRTIGLMFDASENANVVQVADRIWHDIALAVFRDFKEENGDMFEIVRSLHDFDYKRIMIHERAFAILTQETSLFFCPGILTIYFQTLDFSVEDQLWATIHTPEATCQFTSEFARRYGLVPEGWTLDVELLPDLCVLLGYGGQRKHFKKFYERQIRYAAHKSTQVTYERDTDGNPRITGLHTLLAVIQWMGTLKCKEIGDRELYDVFQGFRARLSSDKMKLYRQLRGCVSFAKAETTYYYQNTGEIEPIPPAFSFKPSLFMDREFLWGCFLGCKLSNDLLSLCLKNTLPFDNRLEPSVVDMETMIALKVGRKLVLLLGLDPQKTSWFSWELDSLTRQKGIGEEGVEVEIPNIETSDQFFEFVFGISPLNFHTIHHYCIALLNKFFPLTPSVFGVNLSRYFDELEKRSIKELRAGPRKEQLLNYEEPLKHVYLLSCVEILLEYVNYVNVLTGYNVFGRDEPKNSLEFFDPLAISLYLSSGVHEEGK